VNLNDSLDDAMTAFLGGEFCAVDSRLARERAIHMSLWSRMYVRKSYAKAHRERDRNQRKMNRLWLPKTPKAAKSLEF
jgi:hypothetical protein